MEISELTINVITAVMVISRIALFEERRNFTKEPNVFFIFCTGFVCSLFLLMFLCAGVLVLFRVSESKYARAVFMCASGQKACAYLFSCYFSFLSWTTNLQNFDDTWSDISRSVDISSHALQMINNRISQ